MAARRLSNVVYMVSIACLMPLNWAMSLLRRNRFTPRSVLHISHMVHIPYQTTRILREHGVKADYLAIGTSPTWSLADYIKRPSRIPFILALQEFLLLWKVLASYEVIHLHFMLPMTKNGWELAWLKRMGRRIIINYRGCEIRDRERNTQLHPEVNICQRCDYNASICTDPVNHARAKHARRFGDAFLVTTPDMLDFASHAEHFPFFAPESIPPVSHVQREGKRAFNIVHVTNHPGIEGTAEIGSVIGGLQAKGLDIAFKVLSGVTHDAVMRAYAEADLAIGKMKMGYYANAQIESMALGVPTVTWVRPEFMTPELQASGFIFTTLAELPATLEQLITEPSRLADKRSKARASVLALHDNRRLANRLIRIYGF